VPWKNGGGVTRDVAVFPPGTGLDDFAWRLSIADVHVASPFSHFAGIDRSLSVLTGSLELAIEGDGVPVLLVPETGAHAFPGDVPVSGRPIDGMVRDLNLMVRRGAWRGRVDRLAEFPAAVAVDDAATMLVVATGDACVEVDEAAYPMTALDALLVEGAGSIEIARAAPVHVVRIWSR